MIPFIDFDNDFLDTEALLFLAGASGGTGVEATATGNPLVFTTDLARPLKSLLIPFTPQQEGSGDPSPDNIRSILPRDGLTVWNGGKNLFDSSKGIELTTGFLRFARNQGKGEPFHMKKGFTYAVSINSSEENPSEWQIQRPYTGESLKTTYGNSRITYTPTEDIDVSVMAYWQNGRPSSATDFQIEFGSTATAYEPYKPITETDIPFASTVYGGTLDVVSGVLTVEWICYDLSDFTWEEYTTNRVRSDYLMDKPIVYPEKPNDYPEVIAEEYIPLKQSGSLASNHNGLIIVPRSAESAGRVLMYFDGENYPSGKACFKLATPQEIQLTPAQITALLGNNTIWSDADGSMTAVYLKKG